MTKMMIPFIFDDFTHVVLFYHALKSIPKDSKWYNHIQSIEKQLLLFLQEKESTAIQRQKMLDFIAELFKDGPNFELFNDALDEAEKLKESKDFFSGDEKNP